MVQRPQTQQVAGKIVQLKPKESVRPHSKVPHTDLDWVLTQSSRIIRLFIESWRCESFGGQWRPLKSTLRGSHLRTAQKVLENAGLFKYEPIHELTKTSRHTVTGYKCQNLHGYYSSYWDDVDPNRGDVDPNRGDVDPNRGDVDPNRGDVDPNRAKEQPKTTAGTEFEISQPRLNHVSTTPQLPTKVVGGGSSFPQETKEPPLGGALPTSGGKPEEEENDSLRSTDEVPPPPPRGSEFRADSANLEVEHSLASLKDETQAASEEPEDLGGGNFSAAAPLLPANFPIQVGDVVCLDWPGSPFDGRIGSVHGVDVEASEADIGFDGMDSDATFPIARLFHADPPASPDQLLAGQLNDAASLTASDNSNLVEEICAFALAHDCRIEDAEKEEMQSFNSNELENLLSDFQKQIAKWSCGRGATKRQRFQFALTLARARRRSKDC